MDARDADYADFVRSRTHVLLRSAYLLTGDQHLAEDLVQEALARTHRAWARLERAGNAEAYTRKVMYHAQVSVWRRPKVAEALPGELPDRPAGRGDDPADAAGVRISLQRALLQLSAKQRAVIVLRFLRSKYLAMSFSTFWNSSDCWQRSADRACNWPTTPTSTWWTFSNRAGSTWSKGRA